MSNNFYASTLTTKLTSTVTPQSRPLPGRESEMVVNNAGGFTFTLDKWGYLDRFLILGSDKPSYYASAKKLTKDAAKNVLTCINADGTRTVNRIVEVSDKNLAPKNDPAIFALALCAVNGNGETVKAAYEALPKVARTGTHLFQFVGALDELGKWNASAKRGIANWYTKRSVDRLAVQLMKYQSREGWSHRDVLRLAHVKPTSEEQSNLFRYVVKGSEGMTVGMEVPKLIVDFELLKRANSKHEVLGLITSNSDLTWEMVPTQWHTDKDIMLALAQNMGMTAIIRKLGVLTAHGVLAPLSAGTKLVIQKLSDAETLKKQRVHPITLLSALRQYSLGHGLKGSMKWTPVQTIVDTLNDAFYDAFNYIPTTGENYLLGIDISGSMFGGSVSGVTGMCPAEVAACMALAVAKREPNYELFGFDTKPEVLKITPRMRLDNVVKAMRDLHWSGGATDCAMPMRYALDRKINGVNKFCIYTDNETWAGEIQPAEALARYRQRYVKNAKLIVCGTTATNFTIADPKDPGMLDVVGFDSNVPALIQQF